MVRSSGIGDIDVVLRVSCFVRTPMPRALVASEPSSHGGPGTGKSHVITAAIVKELFTRVLKWNIGIEYQVVALQAVMAALIGGDTIHHACGLLAAHFRHAKATDEAA